MRCGRCCYRPGSPSLRSSPGSPWAPGKPPLEPGLNCCLSDMRAGGTRCWLECWCGRSCQCPTSPAHLFPTPRPPRRVWAADCASCQSACPLWAGSTAGLVSLWQWCLAAEKLGSCSESFGFLQQAEGAPTWGSASFPRGRKPGHSEQLKIEQSVETHHRLCGWGGLSCLAGWAG